MRNNIFRTALAVCMTAPAAAHADIHGEGMPFLGDWDCEVAIFSFADVGYYPDQNADDPLYYVAIEALDPVTREVIENASGATDFVLTFDDGYQIGLSNLTDTTMGWYSGASGDQFDCTRVGS